MAFLFYNISMQIGIQEARETIRFEMLHPEPKIRVFHGDRWDNENSIAFPTEKSFAGSHQFSQLVNELYNILKTLPAQDLLNQQEDIYQRDTSITFSNMTSSNDEFEWGTGSGLEDGQTQVEPTENQIEDFARAMGIIYDLYSVARRGGC